MPEPGLTLKFNLIRYRLSQVVSNGLKLWHKMTAPAGTFIGAGSVDFPGTEHINCGNDSSLDLTSSFTVMCWAYNELSGSGGLLTKWDGANQGYMLYFPNATNITTWVNTSNGNADVTAHQNRWAHYCGTWDGATATTYVNGVNVKTAALATLTSVATNFNIGAYNDGTAEFNGNINNAAVWSRALSQEEIRSVMNKTYEQTTTDERVNMVSWWPLEDSTDLTDSHGSNDGTEV